MPLHHYTGNVYDIVDSRELHGSWGNSAVFGDGVYFTSLPASTGQKPVAQNNWNNIWETQEAKGSMGGVVKIYDYKNNDSFDEVGECYGRDVWLCRTSCMDLSDYDWAAFTIEWQSGNYLKKLTRVGGNH